MKRYILCTLGVLFCTVLLLPEKAVSQDLRIRSIRRPFKGEVLTAGERFRVEADEINNTNTDAGPNYTGYYLSKNTTLDGSDILMGKQYRKRVTANPFGGDFEWSPLVPSNTPSGTYHVLVVADVDNQISETNESNNVGVARNGPFTVINPTQPVTTTTTLDVNSCSSSSNCNPFYNSNPCPGFDIKVSHGSPQLFTYQGVKSILLRANTGDEGFYFNYAFKPGNTYTVEVFAYGFSDVAAYGRLTTSVANNLTERNNSCSEASFPQGTDRELLFVADVGIQPRTYSKSSFKVSRRYNQLWVTSTAFDFPEAIFVERIVIKETTNPGGRTASSPEIIANDYTKDRSKQLDQEVKVFPNPSENYVNVSFNTALPSNASIHDLSGRMIWEKDYQGIIEESIDLTKQPPGVYLLKVVGQKGTQVRRFVRN